MAFIGRAMDRWAEDESAELDSVMWRLYGPMLRVSWIFPSWTHKTRFITVITLIWYISAILFHGILLLVSVLLEVQNSISLSSLMLHYLLLMMFLSTSVVISQFNRKSIASVHGAFLIDLRTYCSGRIYGNETVIEIQKQIDRETIKLVFIPTIMTGIVTVASVFGPYFKNFNTDDIYTPSGVSKTLPVPCWYPFETHSGVSHGVTVALQLALAGSLVLVAIADLLFMWRIAQKIRFEYKVLGYSIDTILDRAAQMHKENHPERLQNKEQWDQWDPGYQYYIGLCLRDCVLHHLKIIELIGDFEQVVSWQIALAYFTGMGVIGLSLVNILWLWGQGDYENAAVFMMLMFCETMNMFLITAVGEAVTTESQNLRNHLYFMNWPKLNARNRKVFMILQANLTEPVILKAGFLMEVCLDTFTTIINSAYSFFNLMNVGIE